MADIRATLAAKILWMMAALSLLLVVLTSGIEIWQEDSDLVAQEQREANAVVMANRDALSLALWSIDQRAVETIARSMVRGAGIHRIEVLEGRKLQFSLDRNARPFRIDHRWEIPLLRPGTGQRLGTLLVFENYDNERAHVRRRAVLLVIGELVKILAISIFLFFLVHVWITRPLARLARQVQDNAASDSARPIAIPRPLRGAPDEIDALVDALNHYQDERHRLEAQENQRRARESQTGKLAALGQLAGGIAHDFNNLLGAILGFGALLADDIRRGVATDHYVLRMIAAAERGRDLVKQILAFARAGEMDRGVLDLRQIVRQSESLLSAALPKTTSLEFTYADESLPIAGNAARLGQLVVNLCLNASEALGGKPGMVQVDVSRATQEELRELETPAARGEHFAGALDAVRPYARLRITDSGEGIAPEILDRIFEPFFTTKGRHHGTGLGLAVVHGVVESHGGACHIRSRPGQGSAFSIYLPLSDAAPAAAPPSVTAKALGGRERLLVVDDETDLVDMLVAGFVRLGYEAVGVSDPAEALAAFQEQPDAFDIVVTDQVMPTMSGLELTALLKAVRSGVKIILCTGYSDNISEARAFAAGVDAFHIKPIDAPALSATIRMLIDGPAVSL